MSRVYLFLGTYLLTYTNQIHQTETLTRSDKMQIVRKCQTRSPAQYMHDDKFSLDFKFLANKW